MLCTLMILSTIVTGFSDIGIPYRYDHRLDANYKSIILPNLTLLYDNVWATVYNPEKNQCDETPFLTGDGSIINNETINNLRWIAISQEMLNCANRQKLLTYSRTNLYKGKINYGDTIWISSKFPEINGAELAYKILCAKRIIWKEEQDRLILKEERQHFLERV